jgi:hypothetical protein
MQDAPNKCVIYHDAVTFYLGSGTVAIGAHTDHSHPSLLLDLPFCLGAANNSLGEVSLGVIIPAYEKSCKNVIAIFVSQYCILRSRSPDSLQSGTHRPDRLPNATGGHSGWIEEYGYGRTIVNYS